MLRIISPIPCIMLPTPAGVETGGAADAAGDGASGGAGATDGVGSAGGAAGWCCSCPPEGSCATTTSYPTAPVRRRALADHNTAQRCRIVTACYAEAAPPPCAGGG